MLTVGVEGSSNDLTQLQNQALDVGYGPCVSQRIQDEDVKVWRSLGLHSGLLEAS